MGKKKILYYTDCPFFAGCENMIANFFNSEELRKEFDIVLVYRYSKEYEEGAKKRMDISRSIPINLVTEPNRDSFIKSGNSIIARVQWIVWVICILVMKYYSILINYNRLTPVFMEYNPDIIHINNGGYPAATSCYSAVLSARRCGCKNVVYVVNNMAMGYGNPIRWFDRGLDRIVKQQVKYFVNGSNNAGNRLKEVLNIPSSQQATIRNGIVPREITMNRMEFREVFNIEDGKFVFAEVANLEKRKGHRVLLQAIKLLKEEGKKDFLVLLEGKGPLKEEIAAFISENKLKEEARMIEVDRIYNLYNAIDALILPSLHTEDFPNVIIEAMGQGLPVVGTSIAGIPEQIDDHINGLLIAPNDVDALANAMKELMCNKDFCEFCSMNARNKFNKNYTAEISVSNYMKLYSSFFNDPCQ